MPTSDDALREIRANAITLNSAMTQEGFEEALAKHDAAVRGEAEGYRERFANQMIAAAELIAYTDRLERSRLRLHRWLKSWRTAAIEYRTRARVKLQEAEVQAKIDALELAADECDGIVTELLLASTYAETRDVLKNYLHGWVDAHRAARYLRATGADKPLQERMAGIKAELIARKRADQK